VINSAVKVADHSNHSASGLWLGASLSVCAGSGLVMLALIIRSPAHPVYDEGWFLSTLQLLRDEGFSVAFIRKFPGAPGPTFTFVYAAVESAFGLALPWLRLVSFALLCIAILLMYQLLRALRLRLPGISSAQSAWLTAGMLVALPTTAVSAGMTLTEMPALCCVMLCLWSIKRAEEATPYSAYWSLLAGAALGLAVLGRQNYLILLPSLALLLHWPVQVIRARDLAIVCLIAAALFAPVFLIWGGLVSPSSASSVGEQILPLYAILSAGYLAIAALIIAPEGLSRMVRGYDLWVSTALALIVAWLAPAPILPLHTVSAMAGPTISTIAAWTFTVLALALGFVFIAAMLRHMWDCRHDRWIRFCGTVVLVGAASNAKIYEFSSRYVFVFLPFLLLSLARQIRLSWHLPWRLAAGALVSLTSLASYLR
jgi:4-amino-4-deoxy-L-arabinose transferase-like glycosyltransferase